VNTDTELLRKLVELAEKATPGPWKFHQILDEIEARAILDGKGYHFARCDDLQNGEFIDAARTILRI